MTKTNGHLVLPAWKRVFRAAIGALLIGVVMADVFDPGGGQALGWMALAPLVAVYPILSAITGWELLLLGGDKAYADDVSKKNAEQAPRGEMVGKAA